MCTLVILKRPTDPAWPLVLAANRDEMQGRPWRAPARHWADRPSVIAGQDIEAGGTWLGLNDQGVVAGVLNRPGSLGPAVGKRSRGDLPLMALDHRDADTAARALATIEAPAWRPFNLFIGDGRTAFWLSSDGVRIHLHPVPDGVSMLTAHDLNHPASPRIRHFRPLFAASPPPEPEAEDGWDRWIDLLSASEGEPGAGPEGAMTVRTDRGFATLSASLIALPRRGSGQRAQWRFSSTPPGNGPWQGIPTGSGAEGHN